MLTDVTTVPLPRLLTQRDLCEWLGKSNAWAERGRLEGYGPNYIKVGRSVRYRAEDVLLWLEGNRRRSTSDGGEAA